MHKQERGDAAIEGKPQRQTYTIMEFAALLGVGRNQAYEAARLGQIPTLKIGKRLLVPRLAGDRMLRGEVERDRAAA